MNTPHEWILISFNKEELIKV